MVPSQLAAHHLHVLWKILGDLVPSKKGKVSRCCPKRTLSSLCLLAGQHRLELLKANLRVEGVTEPMSKTYLLPTSRCPHGSFSLLPTFWGCPLNWSLGRCCRSQSRSRLCTVPCVETGLPEKTKGPTQQYSGSDSFSKFSCQTDH